MTESRFPAITEDAIAALVRARSLFANWLALFTKTAPERSDTMVAAKVAAKAQRIATSLQLALFHRAGDPPKSLTLYRG